MQIEVYAVAADAKTTRNPNYKIEVNTYFNDKAIFAVFASKETARQWMRIHQIGGEVIPLTAQNQGPAE